MAGMATSAAGARMRRRRLGCQTTTCGAVGDDGPYFIERSGLSPIFPVTEAAAWNREKPTKEGMSACRGPNVAALRGNTRARRIRTGKIGVPCVHAELA